MVMVGCDLWFGGDLWAVDFDYSVGVIKKKTFFLFLNKEEMNGGDEGAESAAQASPPQPLEWKFSQVFGERTAGEEVQEGKHLFIFIYF